MIYTIVMETQYGHSLYAKFQRVVKLSRELEKIPRKFGTDELLSSPEVHMIELIGDNRNLSVTGLAKLLDVTKGAVSQSLKRLESKGFTFKEEDPANVSRSLLRLTNKGKTAFYAHKHWHETKDGGFLKYMQSLEPENVKFLEDFLGKFESFLKQRIATEK